MQYKGVLVGLGNPGAEYARTRHNAGFALVQALLDLAGREGDLSSMNGSKFNCELWRISLPALGGQWLCAMPQTYMNDSGRSVQPLLAWHKLAAEHLVVAHDEMDIPVGQLRFKRGGGNAGHNGLKSITQMLGTPDFHRLRIGIGHPVHKGDVLNWVLGRPDAHDRELLEAAMPAAIDVLGLFIKRGLPEAVARARAYTPAD